MSTDTTPTPRTDYEATLTATGLYVTATFAQQLEREIAGLIAERDALRAALEDCIESLSRLPDKDGAWRVTTIAEARAALAQGRDK